MYKDIANFLKESPEWIESWFNTPVKAKYTQNPLMIPEIIANVLNYIPLNHCKGLNKHWDYEIQCALRIRVKFLDQLSLKELKQFYEKNHAWEIQVYNELYYRQDQLEDKYRVAIDNEFNIQQEWSDAYCTGNGDLVQLGKQVDEIVKQKKEVFRKLVEVEECILIYGFADRFPELIHHHLGAYRAGFESVFLKDGEYNPADRLDDTDPLDYWGDEDPDV